MAKYKMNSIWEHKVDRQHKVRIVGKSSHFIKISISKEGRLPSKHYKHSDLLSYKIFRETYQLTLRGILNKL